MDPLKIQLPPEFKIVEVDPEQFTASERRFWEEGCKSQARLLLSEIGRGPRLIIPSEEEWIGINLLERDGEL